jgi:hypothetical protein
MRRRLTYANVVASLALFAALGGSSYAAIALPTGSVGTKQIRANAVNTSKVKDHTLLAKDFQVGQLPAGPQGPKGNAGATGAKGDAGAPGSAVAYAHVIVDAGGATVDLSRSKNVTNANVNRSSKGVTCFTGLGFSPKSIVASTDAVQPGGLAVVSLGAIAPGGSLVAACGASVQAAVTSVNASGPLDADFYVVFQ